MLSTVPAFLWAGGLSLVTVFEKQQVFGWFVLSPPGLLAFMVLLIASFAEVNRTPFDLPEAESEIIAGYHTEYSGMRFALFFMAEYMSVLGVSCLATVLYLGGGTPLPFSDFPLNMLGTTWVSYLLVNGILVSVFFAKIVGFAFLFFWVRATLPRMRVDRLMNFAWKYLVPLSIVNVLLAAVWFEVVMRPGQPFGLALYRPFAWLPAGFSNWLVGWAVTLPLTVMVVWFVFWFNRKVRRAADEVPTVSRPRRAVAGAAAAAGP